ncbi:MAG: hypothetical protein HZC15_01970 [Candidatus Omnitrophica bacterium]|nr:hypothetical protein [Candidatus Omnitrophota bacterium]
MENFQPFLLSFIPIFVAVDAIGNIPLFVSLVQGTTKAQKLGVFPLGTPLITGPAVLTTTLMMLDNYGLVATFVSLLLNMFIVWVTLVKADNIMKILGEGGTRAFAKIMYILLAAISIMMIRRGILGVLIK